MPDQAMRPRAGAAPGQADGAAASGRAAAPPPRLAAFALALNTAPPIQRLVDARSALTASMEAGTLNAAQVRMPVARRDLPAAEVADLASRVSGLGDPAARPLPEAVRAGRASLSDQGVSHPPIQAAASGRSVAGAVAGLNPRDVAFSAEGGRYAVSARLNPWLNIVGGVIIGVDTVTRHNQYKGPGWTFASYETLANGGLHSKGNALIGKTWPPVQQQPKVQPNNQNQPNYTVPSKTYDPKAMSSDFHDLKPQDLPITTEGTAWKHDGTFWQHYRDPLIEPKSPGFDVQEVGSGETLGFYATVKDEESETKHKLIHSSFYTDTRYKGPRKFDVSTDDMYDSTNDRSLDRGHGVDHGFGDQFSTSDSKNLTPQDIDFNRGARNHIVQDLNRNGGGRVQEIPVYPTIPQRTDNGMQIPTSYNFSISPNTGNTDYYQVPNDGAYPQSRKMDTIDPYKTNTPFQQPKHFK